MGVIKDAIMQTLKEQGVQAEWVGDKPRRIQSAKQAKYADLRKVEKGYIQGVHKSRKEANNDKCGI